MVDDDLDYAKLLALGLEDCDYEVAVVSNGAEALKRMPEFQPSYVVVDTLMPVMDGLEFAREVKGDGSSIVALVMLSSIDERATAVESILAGVQEVLVKPVGIEVVVEALDRAKVRAEAQLLKEASPE